MNHLDITLWPVDHMEMPFAVPNSHLVRYENSISGTIAQIELTVDSRIPKSASVEILKTLNKWPSPTLNSLSKIPGFGPESNLFDPQFVLRVFPQLELETTKDLADFIYQYGILNLKSYPNMNKYIPSISQEVVHNESISYRDIIVGKKKYGSIISMETNTALAILRDLKAMAKHVIAYSNGDPEWHPWEEAGYAFSGKDYALRESRWMLQKRLTQGLGMMSLTPIFDFNDNPEAEQDITKAKTGLYQAACLQIFKAYKTNKPIQKCSHEFCGLFFTTATGYGSTRKHKESGLKYCSMRCAKNASQLAHRRRKQQGGK
ncbi:MAG TPA: hypothetical protein PKB15_03225 [Acidimicrobiia bacterium]|nr:hypothetical protein [Acidimicrobiia bacterium]